MARPRCHSMLAAATLPEVHELRDPVIAAAAVFPNTTVNPVLCTPVIAWGPLTCGVEAEGRLASVQGDGDGAVRIHRLHQRLVIARRHVRVALHRMPRRPPVSTALVHRMHAFP